MFKNQCISVTDLKKNPSKYIKDLGNGSKIIFLNNKPVAVLSSIDNFDLHIDEPFSFHFDPALDPAVVLQHFGKI